MVEDDLAVQRLMAAFLRSAGYQVLVADSADVGLALFAAREASVVLLLVDTSLPDRPGVDFAGECRRRKPGVEVLLVSGWYPTGEVDGGEWRVIAKPFTRRQLLAAVELVLTAQGVGCGRH